MASCHMVAKVGEVYVGDPLDIEMFKASKWVLDETEATNHATAETLLVSFYPNQKSENAQEEEDFRNENSYKIGNVKSFDFSANLQ